MQHSSGNATLENAVTLLHVLQLIPRHRSVTIKEMRDSLAMQGIDLSIRTLQRYLKTVKDHPEIFPLKVNDKAKPFTFSWDTHSKGLHLPVLTPQETLLLRMCEESLRFQLPPAVLQSLKPLFHDARAQTRRYAGIKEYSWLKKVKVANPSLPFLPPDIKPHVFECVCEALHEGKLLSVRYRSVQGRVIESKVKPLGLVQQDARCYLVCQFASCGDIRHLALHRLEKARVTVFDFDRPEGFDLEDYTARAPFNYAQGRTIALKILTDDPILVKNLEETPFNKTQTIREDAAREDAAKRWAIEVVMEDSLLLDGWLAMHRASILKTTKTLIAGSDSASAPAAGKTQVEEKKESEPELVRKAAAEGFVVERYVKPRRSKTSVNDLMDADESFNGSAPQKRELQRAQPPKTERSDSDCPRSMPEDSLEIIDRRIVCMPR